MTRLSERIAADVLKASGSGLQNYTMNGSRERIIEAASVADDLLEALKLCLPANLCLTNPNVHYPKTVPLDVPIEDLRKVAAAIAKATGDQA